ncbi:BrnT family toxin [Phenylobacterium sp.]|uniref:BrnT family toxin n=1 Tax=Phenylobacterium sp. TaxID=1871053 RepID=UPI0027331CFB|nr:BrnT family toxin [Phenylobacterium sp.]MDP3661152.1 BrnT family toxin [Phenylobacterium sp.]
MIEFDAAKDAANIAKHGISLAEAGGMDLDEALVAQDSRFDYGEDRFVAVGPIDGDLRVLVYTPRGSVTRVISLRPASDKETARWLSR